MVNNLFIDHRLPPIDGNLDGYPWDRELEPHLMRMMNQIAHAMRNGLDEFYEGNDIGETPGLNEDMVSYIGIEINRMQL